MILVQRPQWNARPPSPDKPIPTVALSEREEFIVHYSAASKLQSVRSIQDYHMDVKGWPDIGYNFLVDTQGIGYVGRGWYKLGTHTVGFNRTGIAVCFIGTNLDVTEAAKDTIQEFAETADFITGHALERGGHRDYDATTCPGDNLWKWVHSGMPVITQPKPSNGEDDMKPYLMVHDEATGRVYACFHNGVTRWIGPGEFAGLKAQGVPVVATKDTDEIVRINSARIDNDNNGVETEL